MTGAQLRAWRKARKWTQKDLAKRLQVSLRTVTELEGGKMAHKVRVPKNIELACCSLDQGISEFSGKGAR